MCLSIENRFSNKDVVQKTKASVCVNPFLLKWTRFFQRCHQQAGPSCLKFGVLVSLKLGGRIAYSRWCEDRLTELSAFNRDELQAIVSSLALLLSSCGMFSLSVGIEHAFCPT